jgi:hypothetical protein
VKKEIISSLNNGDVKTVSHLISDITQLALLLLPSDAKATARMYEPRV